MRILAGLSTRRWPATHDPTSRAGILAFAFQPSDSGKVALVQFVAAGPEAFKPILADALVRSFRRGVADPAEITAEFQKHKKNFTLDSIEVTLP